MRRQVHVRVRLGSGEAIEALVLEWLSYPDRALVQLPSRQRPSVVRLNPATGLYSPRSLPLPAPQLGVVLAGLVVGGTLLGLLVPPSPPARPAAPTPRAQPVLAPASIARTPEPVPPPTPPAAAPAARRAAPRPHAAARLPDAPPNAPAPSAPAVPPTRAADNSPSRATRAPAVRYETRLAVLSAELARRRSYVCECGASFHSARELEAHRTGVVYSCIRYPKCQVTSSQPQGVLEHYEKDRDTAGRCWREAVRLGSAYAVVKRPACRTLAADPDHRKVIKVRVRLNTMEDNNPWR
jgi:hypothetical protein